MGFFRKCLSLMGIDFDIISMNIESTENIVQESKDRKPTTPMQQFENKYTLTNRVLGKGNFATVREAHIKYNSRQKFAVKIINQKKSANSFKSTYKKEIKILQMMDHPNIMKLYDTYDVSSHSVYLVTELISGGELFNRIAKKRCYNEREARGLCKTLIDTIAYCHERKIAHRDLKPENLLMKSTDNDFEIKIADFGFAKIAESDRSLLTRLGTPSYVSPEIIIDTPYGTKTDIWSLGVIVFILLSGCSPFEAEDTVKMYTLITEGKYEFHDKYWGAISDDAKELVSRLLTVNPDERISAADALQSKWIQSDGLEANDLRNSLTKLKKLNARGKFKAAAYAVIATNRMEKFLATTT